MYILAGSVQPRQISVITDFKFSSNNESYINSDKNRSRNKENICTKMRALIDLSTQPLKSQFLSSNTCLDSDVEIFTCEAAIDGRILDVNDANSSCRTSCFDGKACTFRFLTPIAGIQRIICRGNSHIVLKVKLLHEVLSVRELFVVSSYHKFITFQEHSLYAAHCIISILLTEYCDRVYGLPHSAFLLPTSLPLSFSWFCCSNNSTPVFDFSGRLSKPTDAQLLKAFFS